MTRSLAVIGAGGHAKEVIAAARAAGMTVTAILDDDPALRLREVSDVPVIGPIAETTLREHGIEDAVIAIGGNRLRQEIAGRFSSQIIWAVVRHPTTWIADDVVIEPGAMIAAGVIVQPGSVIGAHAILNSAATVSHDGRIGRFVHVAPGVTITGEVTIGEGAFMGAGSVVIPRRRIGAWATVGAGAVVVRDIPAGTTVKGVPAR